MVVVTKDIITKYGKNDQILDFRITLTEQLQKAYSQPADSYMANVFLKSIDG